MQLTCAGCVHHRLTFPNHHSRTHNDSYARTHTAPCCISNAPCAFNHVCLVDIKLTSYKLRVTLNFGLSFCDIGQGAYFFLPRNRSYSVCQAPLLILSLCARNRDSEGSSARFQLSTNSHSSLNSDLEWNSHCQKAQRSQFLRV